MRLGRVSFYFCSCYSNQTKDLPPNNPYRRIITTTLGDHVLRKNEQEDRTAPNIATFRHPYSETKTLASGPFKEIRDMVITTM